MIPFLYTHDVYLYPNVQECPGPGHGGLGDGGSSCRTEEEKQVIEGSGKGYGDYSSAGFIYVETLIPNFGTGFGHACGASSGSQLHLMENSHHYVIQEAP